MLGKDPAESGISSNSDLTLDTFDYAI